MNAYVTEKEIKESVLEYLRTTPPFKESIEKRLDFEIKEEYPIYLGRKKCRADAALLLNKKPILIVECKRQGQTDEGIEQLKSYLCGSVARLGIFANSVNPHKWTYLEMSGVPFPFIPVNRVTFEEQFLIECQSERETQEKIRVRSNHLINVAARNRITESKIRQEEQRIITQTAKARLTKNEIQSEVEHQLRLDILSHREAAHHFKQELSKIRREHDNVKRLNAEIAHLKTKLRKVLGYFLTTLIVSVLVILMVVLGVYL